MVHKKRQATRLKAGALQLVVVISLIIAILLGALIYLYGFYRQQDSRIDQQKKLLQLLDASLSLSLSNDMPHGDTLLTDVILTGDSTTIIKRPWGLYDQVSLTVRWQRDSLQKAFFLGRVDSDSTVLYLTDEDRNLSVSGTSRIVGTAFLPKAGIKPAFVDGTFYKGKEEIVEGTKKTSERTMPPVETLRIEELLRNFPALQASPAQARKQSFFLPTNYHYQEEPLYLSSPDSGGNRIYRSDTLIHISADARLDNSICIAPVIKVDEGFQGSIQLFATDSIRIANNVKLHYPSALILYSDPGQDGQKKISIGNQTRISGTILLYEATRSRMAHMVELGENMTFYGDLVVHGMLKYKKPLSISGAVYCYRFITQTPRSLYENYLIDIDFDRTRRSAFYLQSYHWQRAPAKLKLNVLKWLD